MTHTPGDFIRRSPRSVYKIADVWHVRYRRLLNSLAFAKCACSRDFLRLSLRIATKVNQSGWAILKNGGHERGKWPGRSLGMKLKCQIAAIGVKNRPVCQHQSTAKFARHFRWRSNSLRSAYKIASCIAGLGIRLATKAVQFKLTTTNYNQQSNSLRSLALTCKRKLNRAISDRPSENQSAGNYIFLLFLSFN